MCKMTSGSLVQKKRFSWVALAICITLLGQVLYVWFLQPQPEVWGYETESQNFLHGKGITMRYLGTEYRALFHPFYPLLCISLYRLFGQSHFVITVAQIMAFGCLASLIFWIGKEVFSEEVGSLVTLLVCLHPGLFIYTTRKLHPLVFDAFLFLLFLLFSLKCRKKMNLSRAVLGGFILGVTLLSRSTILLFAVLTSIWFFKRWDFHWRKKVLFLVTFVLAAILVMTPWWIRNFIALGRWIPLTTTFGLQLWIGNNPNATGTPLTPSGKAVLFQDKEFLERIHQLNELGQAQLFREEAWRYIQEHPLRTFQLFLKKIYYFWWFSPQSGLWYPPHWYLFYRLWYWIIVSLAVLGMGFGLKRAVLPEQREKIFLLMLFLLSISLFQSIFFVEGRHRLAIEPILLIFSAEGMRLVWMKIKKRGMTPLS